MRYNKGFAPIVLIVIIVVILGIGAGVYYLGINPNNKEIKTFTNEEYKVVCDKIKESTINCAQMVQKDVSLVNNNQIAEATQNCLNLMYSELENKYGIDKSEVLPLYTRQCPTIFLNQ